MILEKSHQTGTTTKSNGTIILGNIMIEIQKILQIEACVMN